MDRGGKKTKVKQPNKVSSSGREIKRPKHLLTTSSDEPSNAKRSKVYINVEDKIKQLKGVLADIETKKIAAKNDAPEKSAQKSLLNVSAKSTSEKILNKSVFRPQPPEKMPVTSTCSPGFLEESLHEPILENSIHKPSTSGTHMQNRTDTSNLPAIPLPTDINVTSKGIAKPSKLSISKAATSTKRKVTGNDSDSRSVLVDNEMEDGDEAHQTEETFGTAPSIHLERICGLFETIKMQYKEIINQNKSIISRLPDMNVEGILEKKLYEPLIGFPISTMEEFDKVDDKNNTDLRKQLYKHLLHLGGSKVRDFLYNGLQTIMTDELVDKFNWQKSEKRREFEAAKDCPLFKGPSTKAEYKVEMVDYVLRATKQRYRKSLKNPRDAESVQKEILRLKKLLDDAAVDSAGETEAEEEEKESVEEDEEFADDELE